jgi:hypothetical protein
MNSEYYAELCAIAEAQRRVPDLLHVARAGGLPPPDHDALERFREDVAAGRISGLTTEQVLEHYYAARDSMASDSRSSATAGSKSSGDAPTMGSNGHDSNWTPRRHRTTNPKLTVSIRDSTWEDLHRFARATADDGLETGGFLFGDQVRSWHAHVSVSRVTSMVRARAETSASLNLEALVQAKADIRASEGAYATFGEIGSWHTHPNSQSGQPSDADLDTWLNGCDFLERRYVGLILTAHPSDERWTRPHVHGWVVRRDARCERATCERALVEINGTLGGVGR